MNKEARGQLWTHCNHNFQWVYSSLLWFETTLPCGNSYTTPVSILRAQWATCQCNNWSIWFETQPIFFCSSSDAFIFSRLDDFTFSQFTLRLTLKPGSSSTELSAWSQVINNPTESSGHRMRHSPQIPTVYSRSNNRAFNIYVPEVWTSLSVYLKSVPWCVLTWTCFYHSVKLELKLERQKLSDRNILNIRLWRRQQHENIRLLL